MKTIIVATDYSNDANNAIEYGAALASITNSKLVLLNAYNLSMPGSNTILPVSVIDAAIKRNQERIKEVAEKIAEDKGICVDYIARTSYLREELDYQVTRLQADLVIMGISKVYQNNMYGNTTIAVLRHSNYPVLAVPEDASFKGISKILFAYEPGCVSSVNRLSLLKEIAKLFKAQVHVYHIEKNKKATSFESKACSALFNIESELKGIAHSYEDIIYDDIVQGIKEEVENFDADVLLMIPHQYGFFESIFHKSKTGELARKVHIPLLTLPNTAVA